MNCQIKDLYKYKKSKTQSTLKKCQPNNCLWRALFQLIGREKGEKRSSHPKNEIKLGLNQLNLCSTFSVTASNYPTQTQRCITVTNDFKTGLATNAKSQNEGLKKRKSDDNWLLSIIVWILTEWECPQLCDITACPPVADQREKRERECFNGTFGH